MELPVQYDELPYTEKKAVREEYVRQQEGKCYHCGMPLNEPPDNSVAALWVDRTLFPPSFFKWPVHLHHSHVTGLTLGAVHNYCNAVLWQYHGE